MAKPLIEGIILGAMLAFIIGPAFISLIQTCIHNGLHSGLFFAIGIALSDVALITLSYLGAIQFLQNTDNQFYVGVIGGLILIGFGLYNLLRKYQVSINKGIEIRVTVTGGGQYVRHIIKGFFLNILNPFILIFWLGVMSFVSAKHGAGTNEVIIFFAGVVGAVFITDTFKCLIASQISRYLNIKVLFRVNRVVGVLLVIFGVVMLIRVFLYL